MFNFFGEYEVAMDAKGRFRLPSQMVGHLGDQASDFMIARGMKGGSLRLFPKAQWDEEVRKIREKLNPLNPTHRKYMERFSSGATPVQKDSGDRLLIPYSLKAELGETSDLVINSFFDAIDIWSKEGYTQHLKADAQEISFEDLSLQVWSEKPE